MELFMEKHHSCLNTRAIIEYFRENHPEALAKLLANLHEEIDNLSNPTEFLTEINNWVSSDVVIRMFENARQITGDPEVAARIGFASAAGRKFSYVQRILLAAYGNPRRSLLRAQQINDRFNRNKRVEIVETTRDSGIVRLHWDPSIPATKDFCLYNQGIYIGIPTLWDLPAGVIDEPMCFFRGDPFCEYHLKWLRRFSLKETLFNTILPWRAVKATIAELEHDKELLRHKFDEVHGLNLNLKSKIDELLRLQQELGESETRFRTLLDQIPGVAIQGFTIDGKVLYWNQSSEQIYGYRGEQAIGQDVAELIIPMDRQEVFRKALALVPAIAADALGEFMPSGEYMRRTSGGELVPVYAVHTMVRLKDKPLLLFAFDMDMREKHRADQERMRLDKLESLGVLAGGIAHDFNNLLTVIVGNIGLASLAPQLPPNFRAKLMEAEKACLQAQALSKRLLTFAKGGKPIKQVSNPADLLEEAATLVLSGSSSRAEFRFAPDLLTIEADQDQIHQVFANLFINAAQAMPNGGIIRVEAVNVTMEEKGELAAGEYVKITIADEGVGIPAKYLGKIFDPYFTTKQKGSGLGLATAFSIVRNHQGTIEVSSEVGTGTTFTLHLPAVDKDLPVEKPDDFHPVTGKGRILVLDDDQAVREVIGQMVGVLGYEAAYASDGEEAIGMYLQARASGEGFAMVIADLTIPGGMGGKEAVDRLLDIDPKVKVVVSSGYSDDPVMASFRSYGFIAALAKPVRMAQLSKTLMEVLSEDQASQPSVAPIP
jgi:two-component system, cell cycle sensor histidine kinase and response regulator CckA